MTVASFASPTTVCRGAEFPAVSNHQRRARRSPRSLCRASTGSRGVAVVHLYEELGKPAFFDSFLEGLTHAAEVARYHPDFKTSYIHTCLDQEALDSNAAFSYFTLSTFGADEDVQTFEQVAKPHPDWATSIEFGHEGQVHHPIVMREVAKIPDTAKTAVEQGLEGEFSCNQDDVVVVAASKKDFPDDDWQQWSGVEHLKARGDFQSATFYKTADPSSGFCQVVRVELDAIDAVELDSLAEQVQEADNASDNDVVLVVYRSLIHVEKGGSPVDILFANRAKDENPEDPQ